MKLFWPRFNQRRDTPDSELKPNPVRRYAWCRCLDPQYGSREELKLHSEVQDTEGDAWKYLEEFVERVRADGRDEFNPIAGIGPEKWEQILTLPPSIGTLESVKFLILYGSHLVRIPGEIGEMANLEEFDPYTSYCLHWFPYEITRCKKLKRSRVSTRALYGNYKYRPPFPQLPPNPTDRGQSPGGASARFRGLVPIRCSLCNRLFPKTLAHQVWISLWVATDVLPLLVNACSEECIRSLPSPAKGYLGPHKGGLDLAQPPGTN